MMLPNFKKQFSVKKRKAPVKMKRLSTAVQSSFGPKQNCYYFNCNGGPFANPPPHPP